MQRQEISVALGAREEVEGAKTTRPGLGGSSHCGPEIGGWLETCVGEECAHMRLQDGGPAHARTSVHAAGENWCERELCRRKIEITEAEST